MTSRQYRSDPAPTIARSIPHEPGSKEGRMSDLSRTVVVSLAMESYRVEAPLFSAVRATLEGR